MKKVIAVFLSLMMVILCMSAYAEEAEVAETSTEVQTAPATIDPELVLGDWYGETDGSVINIRLNEDGTAECFVDGVETSNDLVWSLQDGIVTVSLSDGSDPLSGPYTDGTLPLASEDGMQVLFVREKIETDSPEEPNVGEAAVNGIMAGVNAVTEAVDETAEAFEGVSAGLAEGAKAVADATVEAMNDESSEESVVEEDIKEDITKEDVTEAEELTDESFFHDPEGWKLDGEMTLTSDLLDLFEKAMATEKRFAIQPILHLGTKAEEDFVQHCYLCVIGSLEDPDVESLFMIYINEPVDGEPAFYAGLELMLTLSPYEDAEHAEE
jgi:hypothetical protein